MSIGEVTVRCQTQHSINSIRSEPAAHVVKLLAAQRTDNPAYETIADSFGPGHPDSFVGPDESTCRNAISAARGKWPDQTGDISRVELTIPVNVHHEVRATGHCFLEPGTYGPAQPKPAPMAYDLSPGLAGQSSRLVS